jgi:hypothetical protein
VPLNVMGFWLERLLISSVSVACGCTSLLGRESNRRSGSAGLCFAIFRGAWEALKIILFPTLRDLHPLH